MTQVLIVDDEPSVRLLLRDVLEMEGYDVREAADGHIALTTLADYRPDCVVLDVMMPGMSGIEVLAQVRANESLAGLPVLMLTAANDDTTTWSGWATGANYYLAKPFDLGELLRWVEVLVTDQSAEDDSAFVLDTGGLDSLDDLTTLLDRATETAATEGNWEPMGEERPWLLSAQAADAFRAELAQTEPAQTEPAHAEPQHAQVAAPSVPAPRPEPVASPGGEWRATTAEPLADEMRRALRTGQFWVAYQPIMTLADLPLADLTLGGVEAFARWRHPQRGDLTPAEFLPLAERSGLTDELGELILLTAARQVATWNERRQAVGLEPVVLAVNVSGQQVRNAQLLPSVLGLPVTTGLSTSHLVLEATEDTLSGLDPAAAEGVARAAEAGVRFALDDAGAGDVVAAYLRQFPVSFVKVDRSHVRGIGESAADEAVISTIVGTARRMGRLSVAEGVETRQQAEWLTRLGCTYGQGYYFGHPAPAGHLTETILAGARDSAQADPGAARLDRLDRALATATGRAQPAGVAPEQVPGAW